MLIRTKLRPPRVPEGTLRRDRLLNRLNANVDYPLTLVSAPAGFGKTTLLSSWLDRCPWPTAWLSLDEDDSDLFRFVAYFVAAVRTAFPDAMDATQARLDAHRLPAGPALAASLLADLERLAQPLVLILDDYHLIHAPAVHQLLATLLRHPVAALHLVLATRQDPPWPLAPLRSQQRLAELRARDLRLTRPEIAAFLELALGQPPDPASLAVLEATTEGWVAGLRLATLAQGGPQALATGLTALSSDPRYVLDFLLAEVLLRQPPAQQTFLLQTAILERLCGPLCEAVLAPRPPASGQAVLAELAQAQLFTEALDDQGQWFRYHPLFRQLLQAELGRRYSPGELAACHRRASAWYAQHGWLDEALQHALAGEDPEAVGALVSQYRHALLSQERWAYLERWLRTLPTTLINQQPELLLAEAWLAYHHGQLADLHALLEQVEGLLAQPSLTTAAVCRVQGEIRGLRCHLSCQAGNAAAAISGAKDALETTPPGSSAIRNIARMRLAAALQMSGDLGAAYSTLYEGLGENRSDASSFAQLEVGFGPVSWGAGDLADVERWASRVLASRRDGSGDLPESEAWAHFWLARTHYQHDDLAGAELHFNAALADPQSAHVDCFLFSAFGLALTYQAQHRPDDARQILQSVMPYLISVHNLGLMPVAAAFEAELAILQKDLPKARRWAATFSPGLQSAPETPFYSAQRVLARVLVAEDTPESRHQASLVLDRLKGFATSIHHKPLLMEALAVEAVLHELGGDEEAALAALASAIELAQPAGWIRLFVDLGPGIARLIVRLGGLSKRGSASAHAERVLQAFLDAGAPSSSAHQEELTAPLTNRELEILALLAERWSNREIADHLMISPKTVKRHTLNIYQKLQVNGRRQAVYRAERLGLHRQPPTPAHTVYMPVTSAPLAA